MFDRYNAQLEVLRSEFSKNYATKLQGFLDPSLGKAVKKQLALTPFVELPYYKDKVLTGLDEISERAPYPFLHAMMNSAELLQLVESITRCRKLTSFFGRLYRAVPNSGHFLSWHDDLGCGRAIGLSLNLSPSPYKGANFQIRNRSGVEEPREIPNHRFGDAILFRLGQHFDHRLTPLLGSAPKIAFSGSFRLKEGEPD